MGEKTAIKKARAAGNLAGQIEWSDNETRRDAVRIIFSNYGDLVRKHRALDDPELAALVVETAAVFGPDHAEAMNSLFRRLRDEQYELAIGYLNIPWAVGPRIATWQPWPLALYVSAPYTITLK